ncbi:unnamed protein product, partial [Dovyalis caffra]
LGVGSYLGKCKELHKEKRIRERILKYGEELRKVGRYVHRSLRRVREKYVEVSNRREVLRKQRAKLFGCKKGTPIQDIFMLWQPSKEKE